MMRKLYSPQPRFKGHKIVYYRGKEFFLEIFLNLLGFKELGLLFPPLGVFELLHSNLYINGCHFGYNAPQIWSVL